MNSILLLLYCYILQPFAITIAYKIVGVDRGGIKMASIIVDDRICDSGSEYGDAEDTINLSQ